MRTLTYTAPGGTAIVFGGADYAITSLTGESSPEFSPQVKSAPHQDGATYIDGLYESRDIVIEGAIVALSGVAAARRAIIAALNPKLGMGTLVFYNGTTSYQIAAIPVTSPEFKNKSYDDPYTRFQITFHCPSPFWQDITEESETVTYLGYELEFPTAGIEMVAAGIMVSELGGIGGQVVNIDNTGDVDCPVTIVFYGPADNPKIINNTTGQYIRLVKTVAAGEAVQVTTEFGNKTVTIDGVNAMQYLDLSSTFFQLQPGTNQLEFIEDGTNSGSSATIAYRLQYIGV